MVTMTIVTMTIVIMTIVTMTIVTMTIVTMTIVTMTIVTMTIVTVTIVTMTIVTMTMVTMTIVTRVCTVCLQEGNTDIRNMTLVVPREEESYLIGRASTKGEGLVHRMTRMTEVAPTNSSIVGGGERSSCVPSRGRHLQVSSSANNNNNNNKTNQTQANS